MGCYQTRHFDNKMNLNDFRSLKYLFLVFVSTTEDLLMLFRAKYHYHIDKQDISK